MERETKRRIGMDDLRGAADEIVRFVDRRRRSRPEDGDPEPDLPAGDEVQRTLH